MSIDAAEQLPGYLDSTPQSGRLIAHWNLVISEYLLHRHWEETG
ncbi:MAG: hypothetical protein AB1505_24800 [Candidatus Latescibacterota bacterium]